MEKYQYIITPNTVMVACEGEITTVDSSHKNFDLIVECVKSGFFEDAIKYSDAVAALREYLDGDITVTNAGVTYKGKNMTSELTARMIDSMEAGVEPKELSKFMANVMENPSFRSVQELFRFLEACSLPITSDGHFLAYKRVREDYTDVHSGTFDNSVGQVVEMERNEVNDNADETCSAGLHFCSRSYLGHFGGSNIMVLKIHPKDVVSIPTDYNDAKGRCCKYEVIGQVDADTEIPDFFVGQDWIDGLVTEAVEPEPEDDTGYNIGDRLLMIASDDYFPVNSIVTVVAVDDNDSNMSYRVEGKDEDGDVLAIWVDNGSIEAAKEDPEEDLDDFEDEFECEDCEDGLYSCTC